MKTPILDGITKEAQDPGLFKGFMKYLKETRGVKGVLGAPYIKGGLITGGVAGAGVGAISDKDNPLRGAALGLGVGTVAGGAVGTGILARKLRSSVYGGEVSRLYHGARYDQVSNEQISRINEGTRKIRKRANDDINEQVEHLLFKLEDPKISPIQENEISQKIHLLNHQERLKVLDSNKLYDLNPLDNLRELKYKSPRGFMDFAKYKGLVIE